MFNRKHPMMSLKRLFERIKGVLYSPSTISKIHERDGDLMRIEEKIDSLIQQVAQLGTEPLTIQPAEPGMFKATQEQKELLTEVKQSESANGLVSTTKQIFENQFLQFESLLSIYNSLPNIKLLPPTRGWAGSPDFLAKIIEVIFKEKPAFILEASSGVSTVIIGLALKLNNHGKVISLDHETRYADITRASVKVNEAESTVIVKHCPLRDYDIIGQSWKWYDIKGVDLTRKVDMLVIDGPPRTTQFLARYPAVPLLHKYFSDKVLILLDDANRDDEVIIVGKWIAFLEASSYKVEVHTFNHFEKGMVLLEVCRLP